MKEIKSCLIEYKSGHLVSINLLNVQTIYYSNNKDYESYIVNFGGEDYYSFTKNTVTEASWNLLNVMMVNL